MSFSTLKKPVFYLKQQAVKVKLTKIWYMSNLL